MMNKVMTFLALMPVKSQKGVTMIEYVMLAAVIVTIAATAFDALGTNLESAMGDITDYISGQVPSSGQVPPIEE